MLRSELPILILACASLLGAQALAPPANAAAEVQTIFARFNHAESPGCAAGVSIGGTQVLNAAYGMADLEHRVALTPDSVFEAGSVSKQFTAAAVLLLAEDGRLSIDDPVRKYIPELPDYAATITIRNLLNHTSGLRDWGNVLAVTGWPRGTRANTNANVLDIMERQNALNYAPGAEYSYTNTGFNLLAILVGRVSGKSLADFTRERIFLPLGMKSTQWRDDYRRIVPNRAIAYAQSGGSVRQDMPFEDAYGNGGLLTTVGDLLRWNRNFTDMKVGGRDLIQAEVQQGRLKDGRLIHYAAGLFIESYRGLHEVSHSGTTAAYNAWLGRYPDQGVSVALLCNTTAANPTQIGRAVADVYLAPVLQKDAPAAPAAIPASAAGLYRSRRDHRTSTIEVKDGKLMRDGRAVAGGVEFETGGSGNVTGMRIVNDGEASDSYDKVERAAPSRGEMEAMAGEYVSDEAEVTLKVAAEQDGLVIHRRPAATIALTPTYRDGFNSSLGSVRFLRDRSGRVMEMSIGNARLWDLRLRKVR